MRAQTVVVAFIVLACALHAAWLLMPAAARRYVAARILRLALPERLARPFRRALGSAGGCGGCERCDDAAPQPRAPRVVTLHRRRAR